MLRVQERQKKVLGHNAKLKKVSQQRTDVLRDERLNGGILDGSE